MTGYLGRVQASAPQTAVRSTLQDTPVNHGPDRNLQIYISFPVSTQHFIIFSIEFEVFRFISYKKVLVLYISFQGEDED